MHHAETHRKTPVSTLWRRQTRSRDHDRTTNGKSTQLCAKRQILPTCSHLHVPWMVHLGSRLGTICIAHAIAGTRPIWDLRHSFALCAEPRLRNVFWVFAGDPIMTPIDPFVAPDGAFGAVALRHISPSNRHNTDRASFHDRFFAPLWHACCYAINLVASGNTAQISATPSREHHGSTV